VPAGRVEHAAGEGLVVFVSLLTKLLRTTRLLECVSSMEPRV